MHWSASCSRAGTKVKGLLEDEEENEEEIEEEGEEDAEEEGEKDDASDETPREVVSRVLRIRHMDQGTLPRCYALHEDLEPAEQCFMRVDPNSVAGWPGYLYRPP